MLLALLCTGFFTLATSLELRVGKWTDTSRPDGAFTKLLGDGRRLFANQFITMADVYLHSGFYPSIFDERNNSAPKAISGGVSEKEKTEHGAHEHDADGKCIHDDDEHEKAMDFMPEPRNWLDGFIRRFRITEHTHLENGQEKEVLPWLKIAIELDPQKIDTYVSTSFWLRKKLDRVKDAEQVLREGIRNNPKDAELLFEMGLLYEEGYTNITQTRNLWRFALRRWNEQPDEAKAASTNLLGRIAGQMGRLEESSGNFQSAIRYLELASVVSPKPEIVQAHIAQIKARIEATSNAPSKPVP